LAEGREESEKDPKTGLLYRLSTLNPPKGLQFDSCFETAISRGVSDIYCSTFDISIAHLPPTTNSILIL
jgi:hypothetical protein